jgi:hypothetical protein
MGLIGDLIAIKRMKKITRDCVANGRLTQEQADDIWDSARDAGRNAYRESKERQRMGEQRSSNVKCCENCKYFSYNAGSKSITVPYTCLKHDIDFSYDEINSGRHRRSVCDNFWG